MVKKLKYRLYFDDSIITSNYDVKEMALDRLEDVKELIHFLYRTDDVMPIGSAIYLEELDENEKVVSSSVVSEWLYDDEHTKEYVEEMRECGGETNVVIFDWKDVEV